MSNNATGVLALARKAITESLTAKLASWGVPEELWSLELLPPTESGHGDLTSSVALRLARVLRRAPFDIARELAQALSGRPELVEVEAAGAGFLNLTLSTAWLAEAVNQVRAHPKTYGQSDIGQGERVLIEFVSANPTGPLNAVNGRAAAIGDSLARIMAYAGYRVDREFYVNNAGAQILKLGQAVWLRLQEMAGQDVESQWPEGVYPGSYVKAVAGLYRERHGMPSTPNFSDLGAFAARVLQQGQEQVLRSFRVEFDRWAEEKALREAGLAESVVEDLRQRGLTREQDGAVWFLSTRFGDDKDRVLVKSDGELTYLVPDAAYHRDKFQRGYDRAIDLLGPDHHGYVSRIRAVMEALCGQGERLEVVIVQLVRLLRDGEPVRMSKRGGQFVTLEEVLEEAGTDAARFFFLERAPDTPMDFDLGLAQLKTQANPVYYVQYAGARIHSILRQVGPARPDPLKQDHLKSPAERQLLMDLARFPDVVARAAQERAPHLMPRYLTELAGDFHHFYRQHRIIGAEPDVFASRLALSEAVLTVLERGADLIGVTIPEQM